MPSWTVLWHHQQVAIALIIAVLALIVLLTLWRGRAAKNRAESPEEILERRYAAGEIDEPTYEHMREELRDGRRPKAA